MLKTSREARDPSFLDRYSHINIARQNVHHTVGKNPKEYSPSTFNNEMGWIFLIPSAFIALGLKIPSARHNSGVTMLCCGAR